jgi:hypothetical protein
VRTISQVYHGGGAPRDPASVLHVLLPAQLVPHVGDVVDDRFRRTRSKVICVAATAREGGSRVTFHIDMRPQGLLKPLAPLLRIGLPRELAKRPDQFRAALADA